MKEDNCSRISRITRVFSLVVLGLVLFLFFVRLILPSQVDDVSPFMNCSDEVLGLGDVYFVVPKFGGIDVSEDLAWCNYILDKDKELAMHGVSHEFGEFGIVRDKVYFGEGVEIFERCFGFAPVRFKPGQLKWNVKNDWIRDEVDVDFFWNQVFHKVYHCGDTGMFPNWVVKIF
ncbi:MAG: hypothetical protein V1888_01105 [archaeon]